MAKVECGNCGWEGDVDLESDEPDQDGFTPLWCCCDLTERLEPGSEVPVGDCPECRCFCYLSKDEEQNNPVATMDQAVQRGIDEGKRK